MPASGGNPPLLHVVLLLLAGIVVGLVVGTAFMETAGDRLSRSVDR